MIQKDVKYRINVCTDHSFKVGDAKVGIREKPFSTNCFIKSDNNKNFPTTAQRF